MTRVRRALASLAGRAACASASARELGHSVPERALRRLGCLNLRSSRGATSPLREFGAATTDASRKALGHATRWEIRPATGTSWCPAGPVRGVASSSGSRRAAEDESASHASRVATSRLGAEEAESSSFRSRRRSHAPPSTAVDISDANDPSLRFYGAPADYAGVTVRSSINWPLPLDEIAKLNPKLALAMGASEARVAENNERRPKLDAVTSGRGGKHDGFSASASDRFADLNDVVDPEEARVLASLWEEDLRAAAARDAELDAFRTKRAHEKLGELKKRDAQLSGRKNAPYAPRAVGADAVRKAREEADAQLARRDRDAARKNLAEKWKAATKNGDVSSLLPKPGSKPGVTPRVYNALKKQLLRMSDRATMAKHVSSELSAGALRRLKVADLRRACDVVGVSSVGDKKLLVEMLKAHFDDAERLFAREFVEKIVDLDKQVAARKGRARRLAEAERRGAPPPGLGAAPRTRRDAAAAAGTRATAAAAAGVAAREGAAGKRRIGERASARAARAAARLRGWEDDDAAVAAAGGDARERVVEREAALPEMPETRPTPEAEEEDTLSADDDALTPTASGRMKYASAFEPEELVALLLKAKGADVVSIPVGEKCGWADHFVVATARSPRHIRMLAGAVLHAVKQRVRYVLGTSLRPSIEGADSVETGEAGDDHWMLVDCGSCVVHVFSAEARERYDLEGLWAPGVALPRRNPDDVAMTIDTITATDENDDDGVPRDGVLLARDRKNRDGAIELDLATMRDLDAYDDEYLEPPDWDASLTDLEERRVKRGASGRASSSFGKTGLALDDEGE